MLTELLMKEFGESAWRSMSEQERQRLLMKKKLEERRLRREGKMDELSRLLGDSEKVRGHYSSRISQNRDLLLR